jgi:replication factor A1
VIKLNSSIIFPIQLTSHKCYRYKLPIAIIGDTGSIAAIAFSLIAKDLVERSAYNASQNMKIEATKHVVALQKTRPFHIGMATNYSLSFSIQYVNESILKSSKFKFTCTKSKPPLNQNLFILFKLYHARTTYHASGIL